LIPLKCKVGEKLTSEITMKNYGTVSWPENTRLCSIIDEENKIRSEFPINKAILPG